MDSEFKEKPKRGRRPFQWWLLVVGFWIGVVVGVLIVSGRPQASVGYVSSGTSTPLFVSPDQSALTATAIMAQLNAPPDAGMDTMMATATAIILQATLQAQSGG